MGKSVMFPHCRVRTSRRKRSSQRSPDGRVSNGSRLSLTPKRKNRARAEFTVGFIVFYLFYRLSVLSLHSGEAGKAQNRV